MSEPLKRVLDAAEPLTLAGVPTGFLPLLAADLARAAHGQGARAVVIAADEAAMRALADTVPLFAPEVEVLTLPSWDCSWGSCCGPCRRQKPGGWPECARGCSFSSCGR